MQVRGELGGAGLVEKMKQACLLGSGKSLISVKVASMLESRLAVLPLMWLVAVQERTYPLVAPTPGQSPSDPVMGG